MLPRLGLNSSPPSSAIQGEITDVPLCLVSVCSQVQILGYLAFLYKARLTPLPT